MALTLAQRAEIKGAEYRRLRPRAKRRPQVLRDFVELRRRQIEGEASVLGLLVQVDVGDGLVDQLTQCDERIPRAQSRAPRKVRTGRRQCVLPGGDDAASAMAGANFADPSSINAEIGGDVVLLVPTGEHSLHGRDFTIGKRHTDSFELLMGHDSTPSRESVSTS